MEDGDRRPGYDAHEKLEDAEPQPAPAWDEKSEVLFPLLNTESIFSTPSL